MNQTKYHLKWWLVPIKVKECWVHILFCPVRIGLSFCYNYKETSEANETNKILIDMMVSSWSVSHKFLMFYFITYVHRKIPKFYTKYFIRVEGCLGNNLISQVKHKVLSVPGTLVFIKASICCSRLDKDISSR